VTAVSFDPDGGFVDMPGGAKRFKIQFDAQSGYYWTLATALAGQDEGANVPGSVRNTLVLMRSEDLKKWEIRAILLHHADVLTPGFQYPDWQFDGQDLVASVRTAYDDAQGGANSAHNANYLTFHRFAGFRDRSGSLLGF
jgi:hypothetical protein